MRLQAVLFNVLCNLEIPLDTNRGIDKEGLFTLRIGIVYEIIGELPLSTDTEVLSEVIPQLRIREDDQAAMAVGLLPTPEVKET